MMYFLANASSFSLNLWHDAQIMLQYSFMQRALLMGALVGLVTGAVGTFVVLRHQAFAGEALSDVAFAGALLGAVCGWSPLLTLIGTTGLAGIAMGRLGERLRGRDVAIGTVLAWILGIGDLLLFLFNQRVSGRGTGISGITILFGNLIGTTPATLGTMGWLCLGVVVLLFLSFRPLLFATLDPVVAAARGVPVGLLGIGFLAMVGVIVSAATLAVGALLVFALLLLPAATAQYITHRPLQMLLLAAGLAIMTAWIGISIGFFTGLPGSICISLLAFTIYVLVRIGWSLQKWHTNQAATVDGSAHWSR